MTRRRDYTPETVPFAATPAGAPPAIAQWANSFVWTNRMLATLCSGKVRGGKWHTLIDKVVDADLKSDFDTIPHDRLLAAVAEKVSDRRVLALVQMFGASSQQSRRWHRISVAIAFRRSTSPSWTNLGPSVPRPARRRRSTTKWSSFGSS